MRRRTLILIIALVALTILSVFETRTPGVLTDRKPFHSSRWKASSGWQNTRCGMVSDLTHRVGLKGRTKREIIELLGMPDVEVNGSTSSYVLCPSLDNVHILELTWQHGRVASLRVRMR